MANQGDLFLSFSSDFLSRDCAEKINLTPDIVTKFANYSVDAYINDVKDNGLSTVWDQICEYVIQ